MQIESPGKRTTTQAKRKSPPLVREQLQTKIAKNDISLPIVGQVADHIPVATYYVPTANPSIINQRHKIPLTILAKRMILYHVMFDLIVNVYNNIKHRVIRMISGY